MFFSCCACLPAAIPVAMLRSLWVSDSAAYPSSSHHRQFCYNSPSARFNAAVFPCSTNWASEYEAHSNTATSTFELAYTTVYFVVTSGCLALTYGWLISPAFFRYHLLLTLWSPPRKHRWSWTFMTERRQRQRQELIRARPQTLFVAAFHCHTIAITVTPETSIEDVHSVLQRRGALPDWAPAQRPYFFAPLDLRRSRLNSLSTLQLRIRLPGGSSKTAASTSAGGDQSASGSGASRKSTRTRDNRPFEALFAEERLDEDGNPSSTTAAAPQRKRKRKSTQAHRHDANKSSDASDDDFSGTDRDDGSGSESDNDEDARVSNAEVAD
ncbi:hypothetical protein GGX14DRAFT_401013 [Mycena pura]|uniref:Uncharacterized protein n=1 Tax=Mycena pura TaxID=153505 RepID=A0AAD6V0U9_9AGAR|nr:hypothetical protein GGX14DRAFT_401013 [Mycena pura]